MSYDSSNKRLYTDSTHGLSISEVGQCLGESTRDLGRLCKSSKINPFAKYKPVKYAKVAPVRNGADKYWYRGADGKCGLSITVLTSSTINKSAITSYPAWNHVAPTGGVTGSTCSPFRLLDFNGYRHNDVLWQPNYIIGWPDKIQYDQGQPTFTDGGNYTGMTQEMPRLSLIDGLVDSDSATILTIRDLMECFTDKSDFTGSNSNVLGIFGFLLIGDDNTAFLYSKARKNSDTISADLQSYFPNFNVYNLRTATDGVTWGSGKEVMLVPVIANKNTNGLPLRVQGNTTIEVIPFANNVGLAHTVSSATGAKSKLYTLTTSVIEPQHVYGYNVEFNPTTYTSNGVVSSYQVTFILKAINPTQRQDPISGHNVPATVGHQPSRIDYNIQFYGDSNCNYSGTMTGITYSQQSSSSTETVWMVTGTVSGLRSQLLDAHNPYHDTVITLSCVLNNVSCPISGSNRFEFIMYGNR